MAPCSKPEDCAQIQLLRQEMQQMEKRVDGLDAKWNTFQNWLIGILATSLIGMVLNMVMYMAQKR